MTHTTKPAPLRAAIPAAALAAVLLAGCSTGHIGESWQCPLAEGGSCDSVAAADPAVPEPGASDGTVLAEPLWRVRGGETNMAAEPSCAADCGAGFDPFAWLARLFGAAEPGLPAGARGDASGGSGDATAAGPATANPSLSGAADREAEPAASPGAPAQTKSPPPDPATALLPAPGSREPVPASEPGGQAPGPAKDDPADGGWHEDDLRTGEVVARIWIAPFVDADGVYREASHVRAVLEPAGWRLK